MELQKHKLYVKGGYYSDEHETRTKESNTFREITSTDLLLGEIWGTLWWNYILPETHPKEKLWMLNEEEVLSKRGCLGTLYFVRLEMTTILT